MNKAELISAVSRRSGYMRTDTEVVISALFEVMRECILDNERVRLDRIGLFGMRQFRARSVTCPQTGKVTQKPDRKVPGFKPTKTLVKEAFALQEKGLMREGNINGRRKYERSNKKSTPEQD